MTPDPTAMPPIRTAALDAYDALRAGDGGSSRQNGVPTTDLAVRRLLPVECERLMGWPDDWTATANGKPVADSHRYRACGNGVVANVAEWIGRRLMETWPSGDKAGAS